MSPVNAAFMSQTRKRKYGMGKQRLEEREGYVRSIDEIAERMKINRMTVKRDLAKAHAKIKKLLTGPKKMNP